MGSETASIATRNPLGLLDSWKDMVSMIVDRPHVPHGPNPTRRRAATRMTEYIFDDLTPEQTNYVLGELAYFSKMDRGWYLPGTESDLSPAFGTLDLDNLAQSNQAFGHFYRRVKSRDDEAPHPRELPKMMIVQLTIAQKPFNSDHFAAVNSEKGLESAYRILKSRSRVLMVRQVLEDLESGAFDYSTIDSHYIPLYKDFLRGQWIDNLARRMEVPSFSSQQANRLHKIVDQLAFAETASIILLARNEYLLIHGSKWVVSCIDKLAHNAIIDPEEIDSESPVRQRQIRTRSFFSRWLRLPESRKMKFIELAKYRGGAIKIANFLHISDGLVHEALRLIDLHLIDERSSEDIFFSKEKLRPKAAFASFENPKAARETFDQTLTMLEEDSFINSLLPERAGAIIEFMHRFNDAVDQKIENLSDILTFVQAGNRTNYSVSHLHRFLKKAVIFADLLRRVYAFEPERRYDNRIVESWMLQNLVEDIKARRPRRRKEMS